MRSSTSNQKTDPNIWRTESLIHPGSQSYVQTALECTPAEMCAMGLSVAVIAARAEI